MAGPDINGSITREEYSYLFTPDIPAEKLKERTGGLDYNDYIQDLFDEIAVLEKNPSNTKQIADSLAILTEIVQNAAKSGLYEAKQFLSLCYAITSLTIISGDYAKAKVMLANLSATPGTANSLLGSKYNNLIIAGDVPLAFVNQPPEKQMWFISMIIQLSEKGVLTAKDTTVLKVLDSAITGSSGGAKTFYTNARRYVGLKLNQPYLKDDSYSRLYADMKALNPRFGNLPLLLMLRVLNDVVVQDPAPKYLEDIKNLSINLETQLPTQDSFNMALSGIKAAFAESPLNPITLTDAYNSLSTIQITHDTCAQYYALRVNYFKATGDYVELEKFISPSSWVTSRLLKKEGSYFARSLQFLVPEIALMKVTIGGKSATEMLKDLPELKPENNLERQRIYYIRSAEYRALADEAYNARDKVREAEYQKQFLTLTLGDAATGVVGVLDQDFNLSAAYRTGTAQDQQLELNARCGVLETYISQKKKALAKDFYQKVIRPYVKDLLDGASAAYFQKQTSFSNSDVRLLFLVAQLADDKTVRKAVLQKICDVYDPKSISASVRLAGFAYSSQMVRNYWEAKAQLISFDKTSMAAIRDEKVKQESAPKKVGDLFYIQRLFTRVYFLDVLDRLAEYKKAGMWDEGLKLISDEVATFADSEQYKHEMDFQKAEFENMRYVYATEHTKPVTLVGGVTWPDAKSKQRQYFIDTARLAQEKKITGLLDKAEAFVSWDGTKVVCTLGKAYTMTEEDNDDPSKSAEQYNAEFSDALVCSYIESLDNLLTNSPDSVDPSEPHDLSVVFGSYFAGERIDTILAKKEWSDGELRIMFLAAKFMLQKSAAVYAAIQKQYPIQADQYQGYGYNTVARRAYWEAARGLSFLYVDDPTNYKALTDDVAAIRTEYDLHKGLKDGAYIKGVYRDALLMKTIAVFDQDAVDVKQLDADLDFLDALVRDTTIETTDAQRAEQYYTLIELNIRRATLGDDPVLALRLLDGVMSDFGLDKPKNDIERLIHDLIILNKIVLSNDQSLYSQLLVVKKDNTDASLRAAYAKYNTTKLGRQYFVNVLLNLAKVTIGPNQSKDGDDDPAEQLVEWIVNPENKQITLFDKKFVAMLEPRLRLDFAWSLVKPDIVLDSALALVVTADKKGIADVYRKDPSKKVSEEALKLQMLAYAKDTDPDHNETAVAYYARILEANTYDFSSKPIREAAEILIVLYGYNKNTKDYAALQKLTEKITVAQKDLYIQSRLALAEMHYALDNAAKLKESIDSFTPEKPEEVLKKQELTIRYWQLKAAQEYKPEDINADIKALEDLQAKTTDPLLKPILDMTISAIKLDNPKLYRGFKPVVPAIPKYDSQATQFGKQLWVRAMTLAAALVPGTGDVDPQEKTLLTVIDSADEILKKSVDIPAVRTRLAFDQAWSLLRGEIALDADSQAAVAVGLKYRSSPDPKVKAEAEDLLRLAWAKAGDKKAIDGDGTTVGYAALIANPDFTNKKTRSAYENLLVLYGYTTATRDDQKLTNLVATIEANKATAGDVLYAKALLAKAEMYYRAEKKLDVLKNMKTTLDALDGLALQSGTDEYYARIELRVRYYETVAQKTDKKSELNECIKQIQAATAIINDDTSETALLLKDIATAAEAVIVFNNWKKFSAEYKDKTPESMIKGLSSLKKTIDDFTTVSAQRMFCRLLAMSAAVVPGHDAYEKALQDFVNKPGEYVAKLLEGTMYAARLLLDYGWALLKGDISGKEIIARAKAAEALATPLLTSADPDVVEEANQLLMLSYMKSKDKDKIQKAVTYYEGVVAAKTPEYRVTQAKKLLAVAYAYELKQYDKAIAFAAAIPKITKPGSADKILSPQYEVIITDCLLEQDKPLDTVQLLKDYSVYLINPALAEENDDIAAAVMIMFNVVRYALTQGDLITADKALTLIFDLVEEIGFPKDFDPTLISFIQTKALVAHASLLYQKGDYAGAKKELDPVMATLQGKKTLEEPQTWNYAYIEAQRLQASIAQAQGRYGDALKILSNDLKDIAMSDAEKKAVFVRDIALQKAQTYIAFGDYGAAEQLLLNDVKILADIGTLKPKAQYLAASALADVYFNLVEKQSELSALATNMNIPAAARGYTWLRYVSIMVNDKNIAEARKSLAEFAKLKISQADYPELTVQYNLAQASVYGLQGLYVAQKELLDEIATDVAKIKDQTSKKAYAQLVTLLGDYAALETRDFDHVPAAAGTLIVNSEDGLKDEETYFKIQQIYFESLLAKGDYKTLLDFLEPEIKVQESNRGSSTEGLELLRAQYIKSLSLVAYQLYDAIKFTNDSYAAKAKEYLEKLPKDIVAALRTDKIFAQQALKVIEQKTTRDVEFDWVKIHDRYDKKLAEFEKNKDTLTFWQKYSALSDLIDLAIQLGDYKNAREALMVMYDLGGDSVALSTGNKLGEYVAALRKYQKAQMPTFSFNDTEKGYGYYGLLNIALEDETAKAEAITYKDILVDRMAPKTGLVDEPYSLMLDALSNSVLVADAEIASLFKDKPSTSEDISSYKAAYSTYARMIKVEPVDPGKIIAMMEKAQATLGEPKSDGERQYAEALELELLSLYIWNNDKYNGGRAKAEALIKKYDKEEFITGTYGKLKYYSALMYYYTTLDAKARNLGYLDQVNKYFEKGMKLIDSEYIDGSAEFSMYTKPYSWSQKAAYADFMFRAASTYALLRGQANTLVGKLTGDQARNYERARDWALKVRSIYPNHPGAKDIFDFKLKSGFYFGVSSTYNKSSTQTDVRYSFEVTGPDGPQTIADNVLSRMVEKESDITVAEFGYKDDSIDVKLSGGIEVGTRSDTVSGTVKTVTGEGVSDSERAAGIFFHTIDTPVSGSDTYTGVLGGFGAFDLTVTPLRKIGLWSPDFVLDALTLGGGLKYSTTYDPLSPYDAAKVTDSDLGDPSVLDWRQSLDMNAGLSLSWLLGPVSLVNSANFFWQQTSLPTVDISSTTVVDGGQSIVGTSLAYGRTPMTLWGVSIYNAVDVPIPLPSTWGSFSLGGSLLDNYVETTQYKPLTSDVAGVNGLWSNYLGFSGLYRSPLIGRTFTFDVGGGIKFDIGQFNQFLYSGFNLDIGFASKDETFKVGFDLSQQLRQSGVTTAASPSSSVTTIDLGSFKFGLYAQIKF